MTRLFWRRVGRELSFDERDLQVTSIAVAARGAELVGVVQVKVTGDQADLRKLFVEPSALGCGVGGALLAWARDIARKSGATRLIIESDPGAAPFYQRMGAYDLGQAPSGSIPGRLLPRLGDQALGLVLEMRPALAGLLFDRSPGFDINQKSRSAVAYAGDWMT